MKNLNNDNLSAPVFTKNQLELPNYSYEIDTDLFLKLEPLLVDLYNLFGVDLKTVLAIEINRFNIFLKKN